ncbi:uncharacterized protein KY384_004172 [Bacidia gigantensis]|uniref:uncharacterized protein n=1 Tax=Bacidia gigantensis TaxID=2732470 RepID=UPI001D0368C6|nr:uncharacterized protein KY384_004172 [Bacidia gigantensis]KAG8530815.1 hypothetical protein KY384_004172 [Bacidia gigantensis]
MALRNAYKQYLISPSADALGENAALNYIPTLTTINSAAAIARHNTAQSKVLRKKEEKIIGCIEGDNAISVDVETTVEFISGGGAYLPGLDDNFLADRIVIFPTIRLYWDQGSLLKQVEVIGARAKSWPIRDGKDQARLITSNVSNSDKQSRPSTAASSNAGRDAAVGKPRSQSNNVTRDPHANLALFAPHDEEETGLPRVTAPKGSAKPPPRPYGDLFVGDESDSERKSRSKSPKKGNGMMPPKAQSAKPPPRDYHDLFVGEGSPNQASKGPKSPEKRGLMSPPIAPKSGAGKNYQPSRLFETEDDPTTPRSPSKGGAMKPDPKKYNHFEFGDGDDAPTPTTDRPKTRHQSQWDFEDFVTPQKPHSRSRAGQGPQQPAWKDPEEEESPAHRAPTHKARPDAALNFEFQDDGTPKGNRGPGSSLAGTKERSNVLYDTSATTENDQVVPLDGKKSGPLSSITNLKDRNKNFNPHFDYTDDSPSQNEKESRKHVSGARAKVVNQMGAQWEMTDDSPKGAPAPARSNAQVLSAQMNDKENFNRTKNTGIKSGGDGMGGKKGASRNWGFGDESDSA